mmetsp:Transcript_13368/g.19659  ORF Transcript_13368/g.19659 Transcript_13368/m.19659 type:complete len:470 (-) Transcript_13368:196-1605(-)|eukprot:CAMPEP_0194048592 /NCGR_PEP_ID=MMETSP0009_2-20130614/27811_1 /TAXON_ID=210454 /ORGANISM="Grammatophora oceanica, Strain CCMP 410" /LENGTH=469 /DNA_ID=CAMNT_0038694511 /DNA_START=35 /DNA_END=1444 /DNA_ORIENTATION=-
MVITDPRATPDHCYSSRKSLGEKRVVVSPHITILGEPLTQPVPPLSASTGRTGPILLNEVIPAHHHQRRGRNLMRRNSTSDIGRAQQAYDMRRKGRRDSSPGERQIASPDNKGKPTRRFSSTGHPVQPILRRSSSVETPKNRREAKQKDPAQHPTSGRGLTRQMSQYVMTTQERSAQEFKLCEIALRQMQNQQQKALQKVAERVRDNDEASRASSRRSNELPFPKSLDDLFSPQIDDPLYDSSKEDDEESLFSVFQWSISEKQEKIGEHSPSPTTTATHMTLKRRASADGAFDNRYTRSSSRSLPVMQQEVPGLRRAATTDEYERSNECGRSNEYERSKSVAHLRAHDHRPRKSKKSSKEHGEKKSKKKKKSSRDSSGRRRSSNSSDELRTSGSDNSERRKKEGRSHRRTGSVPADENRSHRRSSRRSASVEARKPRRSASTDGLQSSRTSSNRGRNLRRLQSEIRLSY